MTSEVSSFQQLALEASILRALDDVGYESPSPIQAQCIPHLLEGKDVLGQAQTGTGKTAAFALPVLNRIDPNQKHVQALVLTPTRELAIQVAEAFQAYGRHVPGFHVLPIYGGQSMGLQLRQLRRGAQIVVGTPGRVMDHMRRKSLNLDDLEALVLDEADEMLNMGFIEDIEWILEHTPESRQIALFSATMPKAIQSVAKRYLNQPELVKIKAKTSTVETIDQRYWRVAGVGKLDGLTRILEVEPFDAAIVFVRTKTETVEVAEKLEARGFSAAALNGDLNQAQREQTVERLKQKQLDIVVATDVAARGLDVARITHVINYDIPYDAETYVHRIGRTGRAGRTGTAILFATPRERRMLYTIERATKQKLQEMRLPSNQDIAKRRVTEFKQQIQEVIQSEDLSFFQEILEEMEKEQDMEMLDLAAAMTYLLQRERPLQLPKEQPMTSKSRGRDGGERRDNGFASKRRENRDRDRGGKPKFKTHDKAHDDVAMRRYRLEVGREHGVTPGNIVGAIANESGLEGQYIRRLKIYDTHSTVELPDGMPKDIFQHLRKVRVREFKLGISIDQHEGKTRFSKSDNVVRKSADKREKRASVRG